MHICELGSGWNKIALCQHSRPDAAAKLAGQQFNTGQVSQGVKVHPIPVSRDRRLTWIRILFKGYCSVNISSSAHIRADLPRRSMWSSCVTSLANWKHTVTVSSYVNLIIILISYPILPWNFIYECEILLWNVLVLFSTPLVALITK